MTALAAEFHDMAVNAILEDSRFVVRLARSMTRGGKDLSGVASMALLPALCLTTFETKRWLTAHHPDLAAKLPTAEASRIEGVRNAAKWFDENKGNVEAGLASFRSMSHDHASEFLGNTPHNWARRFETDLGLYRHGGVDILNTHQLGLLLGPSALLRIGPALRDLGETISTQAASLVGVGDEAPTFLDSLGRITRRDVKSWKYYATEAISLERAGYQHVLACTLAFLTLTQASQPSDEGPVFKMQFLGLYQVSHSLRQLGGPIAAKGLAAVPSDLVFGDPARQLRNDLTHYTPHSNTKAIAIQLDRPRQALTEAGLEQDFPVVAARVNQAIVDLHEVLLRERDRSRRRPPKDLVKRWTEL